MINVQIIEKKKKKKKKKKEEKTPTCTSTYKPILSKLI